MVTNLDPVARRRLPGGRRIAVILAVLALTAGVVAVAHRNPASGPAGLPGAPGGPALSPFPQTQSGVDYRPDRILLEAALPALLGGRPETGASAAAELAPLRRPAALAACLSALLPPGRPAVRPVALDYARFVGRPALLVVLPADDPRQVEVFVVGPACTEAEEDLLFYARLPRPGA